MSKFHIHSRKSWGARPPRPRSRQSRTSVHELFIHHPAESGTMASISSTRAQAAHLRSVQNFHMDTRGWSDIAYSYAVFQDGATYLLRGLGIVPAAQMGHNTGTIAVCCMVGNGEKPTEKMVHSLIALKNRSDKLTGHDLKVRPHSAVVSTECPGDQLRAIIPRLNVH